MSERMFRPTDPDFPTTPPTQVALRAMGRVIDDTPAKLEGKGGTVVAERIVHALRNVPPKATTAQELARRLSVEIDALHDALDLLAAAFGCRHEPSGRGPHCPSARMQVKLSDTHVVGLA